MRPVHLHMHHDSPPEREFAGLAIVQLEHSITGEQMLLPGIVTKERSTTNEAIHTSIAGKKAWAGGGDRQYTEGYERIFGINKDVETDVAQN